MRPIDILVVVLCSLILALQLTALTPRIRQPAPCRPMPSQSGRFVF
jgi:hypothetical protein